MKLTFNPTNERFEAISTFDEKHIPKQAGFRWDPAQKRWYTTGIQSALKLKQYADTGALEAIQALAQEEQKAISASMATDADIAIPAPAGLSYLPYQRAGISFASNRRSTLIADEMGLGKTIQALGLINMDESIQRVLVVCPAGLRLNWQREAEKWLVRRPQIYRAGKSLPEIAEGILILGYEEATKHAETTKGTNWDLIVADEAHYLKNPKAKRTAAILGTPAQKWLLLTGTPILNRPIELWPLVQKIDPFGLGANWVAFAKRYCEGYKDNWGWKVDGASNLEELNAKLRKGGMIRREKAVVLKHLPAKRRSLIPLEPNGKAKKLIEEERKKALQRAEAIKKARALRNTDRHKFAADIKQLRAAAHHIKFTEIARIRHQLAILKVPQVLEHVEGALAVGPVVLFAHHTDVVAEINKAINSLKGADRKYRAATITGGDKAEDRQASVDAFQRGELDCLVCSIKAAGVGLTLTHSSHVIFAELDWSPAWMQQAEDRLHRIGQENSVLSEWLVFDGSLEAKMAKLNVQKERIVTQATGSETNSEEKSATLAISEADIEAAKAREDAERVAMQAMAEAQNQLETYNHLSGNYGVKIAGKIKTYWLRKDRVTGKFGVHRVDNPSEALEIVRQVAKDVRRAQRLFGQATGTCCKCRRALTDNLSKYLGLGPDCGCDEHAEVRRKIVAMEEFAALEEIAA